METIFKSQSLETVYNLTKIEKLSPALPGMPLFWTPLELEKARDVIFLMSSSTIKSLGIAYHSDKAFSGPAFNFSFSFTPPISAGVSAV